MPFTDFIANTTSIN